jgi:hypothetical protein
MPDYSTPLDSLIEVDLDQHERGSNVPKPGGSI